MVRTLERILNFTCIYVLSFSCSIKNVQTKSVCGKEAHISTKSWRKRTDTEPVEFV